MKRIILAVFIVIVMASGLVSGETTRSKFKLGFSHRFRITGWDNSINLEEDVPDGSTFTRHRTSVWANWFPKENMELTIKLTNEFRNYLMPKHRDFNLHEIIVDQLYLKWRNIGHTPVTLTIGRQNIILGEGFVVLEGHPLDGSRSIYFNAVRADYSFNKANKLSAFYMFQPDEDNILPVINEQHQPLVEQPYKGFGLYYTGKLNRTGLQVYYLRKDVEETDIRPVESTINTIGFRVSQPLLKRLTLTAEAAAQFGKQADDDRAALGGYFHLDYTFTHTLTFLKTVTLGGIYLSGDDSSTAKQEAWDPVFSRWPKWSESYIYTQVKEGGVANWTNFNSIYFSLLTELSKGINLKLTWHMMGADQQNGIMGSPVFSTGKDRGDLIIARLDFKLNKHTTAHVVWENFNPGDFYTATSDSANWLRFELMLKY